MSQKSTWCPVPHRLTRTERCWSSIKGVSHDNRQQQSARCEMHNCSQHARHFLAPPKPSLCNRICGWRLFAVRGLKRHNRHTLAHQAPRPRTGHRLDHAIKRSPQYQLRAQVTNATQPHVRLECEQSPTHITLTQILKDNAAALSQNKRGGDDTHLHLHGLHDRQRLPSLDCLSSLDHHLVLAPNMSVR